MEDVLNSLIFVLSTIAQSADTAPVDDDASASSIAADKSFPFKERMRWAAITSVQPQRYAGYVISSGLTTLTNSPEEYGPHWDGWAERVGLRVSTGATGLFLEAGIGALWHEDPRYFRTSGKPVRTRVKSILQQTFLAYNGDAHLVPAYAR